MDIKYKATRNGIIGILLIVVLNIIILWSLGFPAMAVAQIKKYSPLLVLLIGGFGFQISLFTYLRHKSAIGCTTTVASGGLSTTSMILCCSHYLVNILPFIGVSALASLSGYTVWFILIGILSNAAGIAIMLYKSKGEKNKIRLKKRKK
ncbi:MAG: hypothetical protein Q7J54_04220 [Candidatus Woesearchaeota archaeon]|nr:hypothetical protein [Candidatus Woesearchaeota archaeon]